MLIVGGGLAVGTVLLMQPNYGTEIIPNILEGAEILNSGVQARWPLLIAVILICVGFLQRLETHDAEDVTSTDE